MRLCQDCKHCHWPSMATGEPSAVEMFAECGHPSVPQAESLIVGTKARSALMARMQGPCGVEGQLFEARKGATGA